jgi:hypothetical protein
MMTSPNEVAGAGQYDDHWRALAKLHRLAILGGFAFIAGTTVFLGWVAPRVEWMSEPWVVAVLAVLGWVCALPIMARAGMPCPRCNKPFFQKVNERGGKTWRSNTLSRTCVNCGLALWAAGSRP